MNIWVDAAIATSAVLSSKNIRTEKDHPYRGTEIWDESKLIDKIEKSENKIKQLTKIFENDELYIHPIKLSKFKTSN